MRLQMRTLPDFNPKSELRNPQSRNGVTLVEVLVSMFLLAIGLMGILALFPMGVLQMAQAVKDERTKQTSNIMEGHAKFLWRDAWSDTNGLRQEESVFANNLEMLALDDPNYPPFLPLTNQQLAGYMANGASPYRQFLNSHAPSRPVYIDPIGFAVQPGASQFWVAGVNNLVPRRTCTIPGVSPGTFIPPSTNPVRVPVYSGPASLRALPPQLPLPTLVRIRLCGFLDDLTFDTNGLPPANSIQRAGDYNAAWLIQRPMNSVRTEINVQVVVYRKRPPADTNAPETVIVNNLTIAPGLIGNRQLGVTLGAGIPVPKVGTWLLLAGPQIVNANNQVTQEAYADFYRVVGVTGTAPAIGLEFAQPIKGHNQGNSYSGTLIQMENIAEVFDKGTLSLYDRPTQ